MIVVIGDSIIDEHFECKDLGTNPDNSDTPMVSLTGKTSKVLGGATNVAENIISLGGECTYVGYYTSWVKETLTCKMSRVKGLKRSNVYLIQRYIDKKGTHQLRIDHPAKYKPLTTLPTVLKKASHVIVSDYRCGTVRNDTIAKIQKVTSAPLFIDARDPREYHGARGVTFKLNKEEWNMLSYGFKESNKNINTFIVTNGPDAVKLYEPGKIEYTIKPLKQKVIDPVGAGDTFLAAYVIALSNGKTIQKALLDAVVASSYSVTQAGIYRVKTEDLNAKTNRPKPNSKSRSSSKTPRDNSKHKNRTTVSKTRGKSNATKQKSNTRVRNKKGKKAVGS